MTAHRNLVRLAAGLTAASLCVCALFVHSLRASADNTTETPKALFQDKCSACHNAPDPNAEAMTAREWQATVNRMLYKHGAKDSISPDQAQTIVGYLDKFAVAEQTGGFGFKRGRRSFDSSDVWSSDPVYSHVYNFVSAGIAAPFRQIASRWSVRDAGAGTLLVVAARDAGGPGMLVAPTPGPHGDIEIEAHFRSAPPPPDTPAKDIVATPLSFGITFDTQDARNYDLASYDERSRQLTLAEVRGGTAGAIQIVPLPNGLGATPNGWHVLRVDVLEDRAKVWLDYDKKIDTRLPDTPGNGGAGIWTNSRAALKSFILDVYPTDVPNVTGVG